MTTEGYKQKYTDRDVREDESLSKIAEEYVRGYGGDFEPLVDARHMLDDGDELSTVVVRKILNSMRHDRDWANRMPVPIRSTNGAGTFVRRVLKESSACANESPHYPHFWREADKEGQCRGIPYSINRPFEVDMKLSIKKGFVFAISMTGALVHRIDPNGAHYAVWMPRRHDWGFDTSYMKRRMNARVSVDMLCNNPSRIDFPVLLTIAQAEDYIGERSVSGKPVRWCDNCVYLHLNNL